MKNYKGQPLFLLLFSLGILLSLNLIDFTKTDLPNVRNVRMLSDITRPVSTDTLQLPPLPLPPPAPVAEEKTTPGITRIIDYADSTQKGMAPFYAALSKRTKIERPVRIAYFGDSFIEGDILTADLRAQLQEYFGGCGAGFTDMNPPFAGFRTSLPLKARGWQVRNVLKKDSSDLLRFGPTLRYAIPVDSAFTEVRSSRHYACLDSFEVATIYLKSASPIEVRVQQNKRPTDSITTQGNGTIETIRNEGILHHMKWSFTPDSATTCFGVALEGRQGITLDNFSLRGSNGASLGILPRQQWMALGKARPYDLIILHFGLNIASKDMLKYDAYARKIGRTLEKLKSAYPEAGFLILSVSDREDNIDGRLQTLPGIKALVRYQQQIAATNHIAFWNLYEAMGGEGSIVNMANASPHEARKDLTHITRMGGKKIATLLYQSLLQGFEHYEKTANSKNE